MITDAKGKNDCLAFDIQKSDFTPEMGLKAGKPIALHKGLERRKMETIERESCLCWAQGTEGRQNLPQVSSWRGQGARCKTSPCAQLIAERYSWVEQASRGCGIRIKCGQVTAWVDQADQAVNKKKGQKLRGCSTCRSCEGPSCRRRLPGPQTSWERMGHMSAATRKRRTPAECPRAVSHQQAAHRGHQHRARGRSG